MKREAVSALMMIAAASLLTGCGSLYTNHKNGYTKINAVSNVEFEMPDNFLENATAITDISQDSDYEASQTYLYKNGDDCFMLFNVNSVIVAVSTATNYDLEDADDVDSVITDGNLNGICFSPEDGKNYTYEESNKKESYKMIADAMGDVSVTTELYGKYAGKFVYVSNDSMECTMFVGANVEKYKKLTSSQEKLIEHVAKSLVISTDNTVNAPVSDKEMQEKADTEIKVSEEVKTEASDSKDAVMSESEEKVDNTENRSTAIDDVTKIDDGEKKYLHADSNQHEAKGTTSDFYHQLKIGDAGKLEAIDNSGKELKSAFVIVNKLYTKDEAESIIKDYCKSDECPYEYADAPDGYSWHMIEYTLSTAPEDLYVNIKLEGLDGEKLKYRGVAASSMTHDIFSYMQKNDDGYSKLYCYYAVPNGCKEYTLEFGTRVEGQNNTACYKISGF